MTNSKIGPNALPELLEMHGLEIVKTSNTRSNIGKRAELVFCEIFDIRLADPPNKWADREITEPNDDKSD